MHFCRFNFDWLVNVANGVFVYPFSHRLGLWFLARLKTRSYVNSRHVLWKECIGFFRCLYFLALSQKWGLTRNTRISSQFCFLYLVRARQWALLSTIRTGPVWKSSNVLIWVDAYIALESVVWFSRCCYIFAFMSMSLSLCSFLYDIMGGSLKIDLAMVVAMLGTTSLLRFLWHLELLGGIMLGRGRFVFLFPLFRGGLVAFVETSLLRVCCDPPRGLVG